MRYLNTSEPDTAYIEPVALYLAVETWSGERLPDDCAVLPVPLSYSRSGVDLGYLYEVFDPARGRAWWEVTTDPDASATADRLADAFPCDGCDSRWNAVYDATEPNGGRVEFVREHTDDCPEVAEIDGDSEGGADDE